MAEGSSSRASSSAGDGKKAVGKVARLARSRAACEACHKVKQRCEGPSVCPCHRCKLWGIECIFPSSAGKAASATTLSSAGSASKANANASKGKGKAVDRDSDSPAPALPPLPTAADSDLRDELRAMHAKLQSIEATLARAQVTFPSPLIGTAMVVGSSSSRPTKGEAASHSGRTASGHSPNPSTANHESHLHNEHEHRAGTSNPVEAAGEALAVEGLVDLSSTATAAAGRLGEVWDATRPDVLGRGVMTVAECDAEFDVYFTRLQPFTTLLSTALDRHPLIVRQRSPLLFHAILLLALYYRPRTPHNLALYRTVSAILDSILAPQILNPQPDQLSPDFIRALHLLLIYKPIQVAALSSRGLHDPAAIEHASKMNVRASWMLRLLISRTSAFIGLPTITTSFARAFANQHLSPISEVLIAEQRLHFSIVYHESHGALQSGKPANFLPHDSLKTTRLFATLRKQASDVRLAASVELAATAATALGRRREGDVIEREDLERFDEEMQAWNEFWRPVLAGEAKRAKDHGAGGAEDVDQLAWVAVWPYAAFVRVVINGFAFTRWRAEKRRNPGGDATLGADDRASIERAVNAAQGILLAVSNEGKTVDDEWGIEPSWEGVDDDGSLTVDQEMANELRWASDSLACVVFSYPLIFLAKLANAGLLLPSLSLAPPSMVDALQSQTPSAPLRPSDKLPRLLQLGADFLDAIAPNPAHPAVKQAMFLGRIREAGINGRRGVVSAPGSPRAQQYGATNGFASAHVLQQQQQQQQQNQQDYALSTSYQPSPAHSPPPAGLPNGANAINDAFSSLLTSGSNAALFDGDATMLGGSADGAQAFFGLDGEGGFEGVRWDELESSMGMGMGMGHGTGSMGLGGMGMGMDGFGDFS